MKRQIFTFALLLAVLCPLAVGATHADMDPDGITAPAPAPEFADWVDSMVRVLRSWLGL